MALATTCPQCKTSFKVIPDQLKLRRGMVRCGICQNVFSGIDFLRYVEDRGPVRAGVPAGAAAAGGGEPDIALKTAFFLPETAFEPTTTLDPYQDAPHAPALPASLRAPERSLTPQHGPLGAPKNSTSRVSDTLASDIAPGVAPSIASGNARGSASESSQARPALRERRRALPDDVGDELVFSSLDDPAPWASPAPEASDNPDTLTFFGLDDTDRGVGSRARLMAGVVASLLVVALLLQLAVGLRGMIADLSPAAGAAWARTVAPLASLFPPARDLRKVTIESFELTTARAPGLFSVGALLRNQAAYGVRWPAMEISLTDSGGRLLARKVLLPSDYLTPGEAGLAFPESLGALAEWPVRFALEAPDLTPAGYAVALFYP